ncbi:MAG TPA: hypothetical protein VI362_09180, partial [Ignavibacteriaceae bacterium]|nr:hypothetical protein [Ignavibacteriaceae bacterium]
MKKINQEKIINKKIFPRPVLFGLVIVSLTLLNTNCSDQQADSGQFSMPPMPVEVTIVTEQKMSD